MEKEELTHLKELIVNDELDIDTVLKEVKEEQLDDVLNIIKLQIKEESDNIKNEINEKAKTR